MIVGLAATAVKVVVVAIVVVAAIVAVTAKVAVAAKAKTLIRRMVNDTVVSVFDIHRLICMYIC